jgi:uncharacterized protein (TIGR00297 family)
MCSFFPLFDLSHLALAVLFSVLIAYMSYLLKFLSASGSVATFFLACILYGIGDWKWTVPILTVFVLSSILSKIGKNRKHKYELNFEKTGTRDWGQVLANGGIAGTLVIAQAVFSDFNFYPLYLGAVAAVTADTWGTEIGLWFHHKTISINRFTIVEPGSSGGVSLLGFLGGIIGALIISASSLFWLEESRIVIVTVSAGVSGSLIDSILGGLAQAAYRCRICHKITERKEHCGAPTEFVGGVRWINNDLINGLCAFTGMLIAYIFTYYI